jgi:hypothetical protein
LVGRKIGAGYFHHQRGTGKFQWIADNRRCRMGLGAEQRFQFT